MTVIHSVIGEELISRTQSHRDLHQSGEGREAVHENDGAKFRRNLNQEEQKECRCQDKKDRIHLLTVAERLILGWPLQNYFGGPFENPKA